MDTTDFETLYGFGEDESTDDYVTRIITILANKETPDSERILSEFGFSHQETIRDPEADKSEVTMSLENLLDNGSDDLTEVAAYSYAHIAPQAFITYLSRKIVDDNLYGTDKLSLYKSGVDCAADGFQENYYGSMCAGMLTHLQENPELLKELYEQTPRMLTPVINAYANDPLIQVFADILRDLEQEYKNNSKAV